MGYESVKAKNVESALGNAIAEVLSNVKDPTSKEKRQYFYRREPYTAGDDFDGFPYAYIEDYNIVTQKRTINDELAQVEAEAEIVIDGRDEAQKSKLYHDKLADRIIYAFKNREKRGLETANVLRPEVESDSRTTTTLTDGKPAIRRTLNFSFRFKVRFGA